jgi:hypothetical protein
MEVSRDIGRREHTNKFRREGNRTPDGPCFQTATDDNTARCAGSERQRQCDHDCGYQMAGRKALSST